MVLLYITICYMSFSLCAADHGLFDEAQKRAAHQFIEQCFNGLAHTISHHISDATQKDNKRLVQNMHSYYMQAVRPTEEATSYWGMTHEADAQALCSYLLMTDAWRQYVVDPLNVSYYEGVHKEMTRMAGVLINGRSEGHYGLVNGTHKTLQCLDNPSYDLDKICVLTLFLLQQELDKDASPRKRRRTINDEDQPLAKKTKVSGEH